MKTAIKTTETNYDQILDEMEDAFLDAPHQKSFTVPQGGFERPTVPAVETESRGGFPILEGLIFCFFSFCLGFWLGVSHTNGVIKNSQPHIQAEQAAGYAVLVLLPLFWLGGLFLYYREKK